MFRLITLLIAFVLALGLTGCVPNELFEPEQKPRRPFRLGDEVSRGEIVLVTMNSCRYCDMQKAALDRLDLSGYDYQEVNHDEQPQLRERYPANKYPTLYITVDGETKTYVGFQRDRELKRALKM